jgi:hypothetical protein
MQNAPHTSVRQLSQRNRTDRTLCRKAGTCLDKEENRLATLSDSTGNIEKIKYYRMKSP